MALGLFSKEKYDYGKDLLELKKAGVNSILLNVSWYQRDIRSLTMEPRAPRGENEFTVPDVELARVIRQARQLGMSVLLFPYLRFDHRAPKEWRGVLEPKDFPTWAKNYERFILHYAQLAQTTGVEYLSVGSELGSLEGQAEFWKDLIRKVRKQYGGKLLYSANWDHYSHPAFWEDLDYLGVTAYHKLSNAKNPSLEEVTKKWVEVRERLLAFSKKFGKKILITEVGYPSLDGAVKAPWNYLASTEVDLQEQELGYQAFIQAWSNVPGLQGVYWWVWYGEGGPADNSYTPRGKPALARLAEWYGRKIPLAANGKTGK
jgi:hypothetical protein